MEINRTRNWWLYLQLISHPLCRCWWDALAFYGNSQSLRSYIWLLARHLLGYFLCFVFIANKGSRFKIIWHCFNKVDHVFIYELKCWCINRPKVDLRPHKPHSVRSKAWVDRLVGLLCKFRRRKLKNRLLWERIPILHSGHLDRYTKGLTSKICEYKQRITYSWTTYVWNCAKTTT